MPIIVLASAANIPSAAAHSLFEEPVVSTDLYDYGNCTYWAALRRIQTGNPIPNTWGNANTWDDHAILDNYLVDHSPADGAIMQTDAGALGHVAYVEFVNPADGSWTISEMNVLGWDELDQKTLPSSSAKSFKFIHDKIIAI
ncbi:MAG TPA: CHAP domain-containing protein [Patescibacteria group bacterium]|nr:CHAP domain-containing protein [Patescibacteria group bacterium]